MEPPHIRNKAGEALLLMQTFLKPPTSYNNRFEMLFLQIFSAVDDATDMIVEHRKPPSSAEAVCIPKIKEVFDFYSLIIPADLYQDLHRYFSLLDNLISKDTAETLTQKELCVLLNVFMPLLSIDFDLCFALASKKSGFDKGLQPLAAKFLHHIRCVYKLARDVNYLEDDLKQGNFNVLKFAKDYKIKPKFFADYAKRNLRAANILELFEYPEFSEEFLRTQRKSKDHLDYLKELLR